MSSPDTDPKKKEYLKNKEGYFRRARKSYSKTFFSPEARLKRMVVEARSRAKARGIEFDIEYTDIMWNWVCPVLGIEITTHRKKGHGGDDNSPSIDRIDNNKGYVPGNVRLISNKANKLKNRMTKEECRLILENWDEI